MGSSEGLGSRSPASSRSSSGGGLIALSAPLVGEGGGPSIKRLVYALLEGNQRAYVADLAPQGLQGTALGVYYTLVALLLRCQAL